MEIFPLALPTYIFIVLGTLLVLLVVVVIHAGLFYSVKIQAAIPRYMPARVAYKFYRGPYKNAGAGFTELIRLAPQVSRCVGVFYDDPHKVSRGLMGNQGQCGSRASSLCL